jgi:hypothetical protein
MRLRIAAALLALLWVAPAQAQCIGFQCPPGILGAGSTDGPTQAQIIATATLDFNFSAGTYRQTGVPGCTTFATCVTFSRTQGGAGALSTNLLYVSPSGFAYTTYAANVPRFVSGGGLLAEPQVVNRLLNSAVPATQTTASLATGTYVLWVNGSGSAQATAGSAVGTGFGGTPASQGAFKTFTISSAGTVVVTVTGSLNAFQLELSAYPSSFILTVAAVGTRGIDVAAVTSNPVIGSAYSLLCHGVPLLPISGPNQTMASISDGTATNFMYCRRLATSGLLALQGTAGIGITDTGPAIIEGGLAKMAFSVNSATPVESAAFNSGSLQQDLDAPPAGLNAINIGTQGTTSVPWVGYISGISFWPVRLSGYELITVSR